MLFAHNNQLKQLPVSLSTLENLRFLDLHNNMLEELPDNFGVGLGRLAELILFKNALRSIPPTISGLKHVVKLELQYNCLEQLPSELGELVTLQTLNVAHNKLVLLPNEISRLTSLTRLELSHNRLTDLPESMKALKARLQSLWIDNNELDHVPEPVLHLENLNLLSLRANHIGPSLPVQLSKLSKLSFIWLNDNQIEMIPAPIAEMQNLQDLYLPNNPCFRFIQAAPNATINPDAIPLEDTRCHNIPSLCALLAKQIIIEAKRSAPADLARRSSLLPYVHSPDGSELPHEVVELIDTLEDRCTKCLDPTWGYGREHVYEEEWYPGQFIRIGWRHCWHCTRK